MLSVYMLLKRSLGFSFLCPPPPPLLAAGLDSEGFGSMLLGAEGLGLGMLMLVGGALDTPPPFSLDVANDLLVAGLGNEPLDCAGGLLTMGLDVPSGALFFATPLGEESL